MAKVYMVYYESGEYSEFLYAVEGVFSSREKAVGYIESLRLDVGWNDTIPYCTAIESFNKDIYDHKGTASAVTRDGETWTLECEGMPARRAFEDVRTYYVAEYELDGLVESHVDAEL